MSKVLVASLQVGGGASKGHINPMIGIVQRLVRDGHDVAWMSLPHRMGESDRKQALATGARLLSGFEGARYAPSSSPPGGTGQKPSTAALAALTSDPSRAWEVYRSFLLDPLDAQVPALMEVIEREKPDVVAADSLAYGAIIAARRAGIPLATICAGLKLVADNSLATAYRFDLSPLAMPRSEAFAHHGVDVRFHVLDALSDDLVVLFSTRDLIGDVALPANTLLAGPSRPVDARGDEPAFPWDRLDPNRPLVYLAFGSVHSRETLEDVVFPFARAARRLGHDLVVASEALAGVTHADLHDAVVVPYAPQLDLLGVASAFVTHGGANSVTEGLDHGVPLVVVPLSGDQKIQARLVTRAGVGVALERGHIDDATALGALLAVDRCRPRARAIQHAWRGCDGGAAAARSIARLGAST